jgi:alpha-amylase
MGYAAVLAEGADHVLDWRSPTCVYRPPGAKNIKLLLKHYRLSDDIAFRFSNRQWSEWPLTADRYVNWLDAACDDGRTINLFMDYETFGEHQWADSGIFEFLRALPRHALGRFHFATPSEVAATLPVVAELSFPSLTSWADTERDISAWLGNSIQNAAFANINSLRAAILATGDEALIHAWRKLQTSDHFYYMCTKWFQDGDVHKYFNPYDSPYDGFICHSNAVNQLRFALQEFAPKVRRQPVALDALPRKEILTLEPLPSSLQAASADN